MRIKLRDVCRMLATSRIGRQWTGDTWYVRAGLLAEVERWWTAQADGSPLRFWLPHTMLFLEEPLPTGPNVLLFGFQGDGPDEHLDVNPGRWNPRTDVFHVSRPLPPQEAHECAIALHALREFALLELPRSKDVELDVAEPRGDGLERGPRELPRLLIVRWRKSQPGLSDGSRDVEWSHRWIVRAHVRKLKNGRLVPVREHVKGPADRPLVLKRRVDELRR